MKYRMALKALLIFQAGTLMAPVKAQSLSCPIDSHLVTISASGSVEAGQMDALLHAYRTGRVLRIGWELDFDSDGIANITHWADALFLSEFEGVISAQVTQIERQAPRPGHARIDFRDESQRWSGLLSTDGTLLGRFSDGEPRRDKVRSVWCLGAGERRPECADRWRMAFHHDVDGKGIGGDKRKLFDAVRRGRPIRLGWGTQHPDDPTVSVEHVVEPVFVTVAGNELFAQLPEHIAQESYVHPDAARFETPSVMWRGLIATTGSFDAVWIDRASGEQVRRLPQRAQVAWYVYGPDASCETDEAVRLAVPGGVRLDKQE